MNSASLRDHAAPTARGAMLTRDQLRERFVHAISAMYRSEVPQYGELLRIVDDVNHRVLAGDPAMTQWSAGERARLALERHGAIRVASARELALLRRVFDILGMQPVGYYDLSVAGVPVHSTAFRPIDGAALQRCPFRMFTSLLRPELIEDRPLRAIAEQALRKREICTPRALRLIEEFEAGDRFSAERADAFVGELLRIFGWHAHASVSRDVYRRMHDAHRLVADVVCFRGPHINHLTRCTLDIDAVQAEMPRRGLAAKDLVEGPPRRSVPILLRQTSFKALAEPIGFDADAGPAVAHTARFAEVEQRGIALTPKGRRLYDELLRRAAADGGDGGDGTPRDHAERLRRAFGDFPDDLDAIREQRLGYFEYAPLAGSARAAPATADLDELVRSGVVRATPIVYEDFLPVSAAGIFQSNLGDAASRSYSACDARARFEDALGRPILDEFALYEAQQAASIEHCRRALGELACASARP